MKCQRCKGFGRAIVLVKQKEGFYATEQTVCPECNGKGIVEQTNEEWFCQLSTEEKAKWLYEHYVNAMADECYGRPEKTLYDYQKWLVDVHKGIDGTRVG